MSISIYKISSTAGEKVYIGSTSKTLEKRWAVHRVPSNDTNSRLLFDEYGIETCSIHLIEEVKEDERVIRERWHIENTPNVVNLQIPGRTKKEWHEEHYETHRQQSKEYYASHREQISAYREKHRETLRQQISAYREKHREQINAQKRQYDSAPTPCPRCGKVLRRNSILRHLKKMHL